MNHHSEKLAVLRVEVGSQDVEAFEVLGQATRLTVPDETANKANPRKSKRTKTSPPTIHARALLQVHLPRKLTRCIDWITRVSERTAVIDWITRVVSERTAVIDLITRVVSERTAVIDWRTSVVFKAGRLAGLLLERNGSSG
jgi:hypothetical protein